MMRRAVTFALLTFIISSFPVWADAITVGAMTQVAVKQWEGKGTYSITGLGVTRKLDHIKMFVEEDAAGTVVSTSNGVSFPTTTEWGSTSVGMMKVGTKYKLRAEITSVDMMGKNPTTTKSQNSMTGTLAATP